MTDKAIDLLKNQAAAAVAQHPQPEAEERERGSVALMSAAIPGGVRAADGLLVPVKLLAALLKFASADAFRSHLAGVGLDPQTRDLVATDGATGARVPTDVPPARGGSAGSDPAVGRVWRTSTAVIAIEVAKAEKQARALLRWDEIERDLYAPPLDAVIPKRLAICAPGPVAWNPLLSDRLTALARAVQPHRGRSVPHVIQLAHVDDAAGPVVFRVPGFRAGNESALASTPDVEVVIMPMRL